MELTASSSVAQRVEEEPSAATEVLPSGWIQITAWKNGEGSLAQRLAWGGEMVSVILSSIRDNKKQPV